MGLVGIFWLPFVSHAMTIRYRDSMGGGEPDPFPTAHPDTYPSSARLESVAAIIFRIRPGVGVGVGVGPALPRLRNPDL